METNIHDRHDTTTCVFQTTQLILILINQRTSLTSLHLHFQIEILLKFALLFINIEIGVEAFI